MGGTRATQAEGDRAMGEKASGGLWFGSCLRAASAPSVLCRGAVVDVHFLPQTDLLTL